MASQHSWVKDQLRQSPVRIARSKHFKDKSDFQLASGASYSVVYFTELGCYSAIPKILLTTLQAKGVNVAQLETDYFNFQKRRRFIFGEVYILPALEQIKKSVSHRSASLVVILKDVLDLSRADLAKGLCVQTASLYRLEVDELPELPNEVMTALIHCGLPFKLVEEWNVRERKR